MSMTLEKPDGTDPVTVDLETLSIPGYVAFLIDEGYDVPARFRDLDNEGTEKEGSGDTVRPADDRNVTVTPGGQPIYGNVVTAKTAMDALYAEKLEKEKRTNPAAFPPDPAEMQAGPAEEARARKWVPPHRRQPYAEHSWSANKVKKGLAVVNKKLNLSAVLRDRSVQSTYGVTDVQLNLVQILMQVSPEKAAIKATECIMDNGHKAIVIADMTAASRSTARSAIALAANEVGVSRRCREIPMVYLPGSALVCMTPREDEMGADTRHTWELTGPSREFVTMAAVWVLIMEHGPFFVAERYGSDYGFLRVLITVVDKATRVSTTLTPGYELHSGNRNDAWTDMSRDLINALQDLADVDVGCVPVQAVGAVTVASAPLIDEQSVIVPHHVLKTPGGKLNGELMEKADVRKLGGGLFSVALRNKSLSEAFPFTRGPVDGETVRLRVVGYDGTKATKTIVTNPARVVFVGATVYVDGIVALPGSSGSVYVADSDGAVVGLHDGSGAIGARMIPLPPDLKTMLHAPVCWYAGGGPSLFRVLSPTIRFWSRRGDTRTAWTQLAARLGNRSGAMTLSDGAVERLVVTLDSIPYDSGWVRSHGSRSFLTRVYRAERKVATPVADLVTRIGEPGEKVVLVCCDAEGVYVSSETTFGQEVQLGEGNHAWSALMLSGALVVAVRDVSVLGVTSRVAHTDKWITFCSDTSDAFSVDPETSETSGKEVGPDIEQNRAWLREKFPFLSVDTYSAADVDECFTHVSCGAYRTATVTFSGYQNMARIGDSVMRARFHVLLRRLGADPQSTTLTVNKWQNNTVQSVIAEQYGLAQQLRRASRLTTIGSHGLADALEALACLVYFNEDAAVLDKFLRVIVMFGDN